MITNKFLHRISSDQRWKINIVQLCHYQVYKNKALVAI